MSAVIINPFLSSGSGPTILLYDDVTGTFPAEPKTISMSVKPGLLVFCVGAEESGGSPSTPTCSISGQGSATQIQTEVLASIDLSLTWFYFENNTTDGAQDFVFTFGTEHESFSGGCWSFENADASDILTSADGSSTGGSVDVTYSGASGSHVLQAIIGADQGATLTGESGLSLDANRNTNTESSDHVFMHRSGRGSDVSGALNATASPSGLINSYVEVRG